MSTTGAAVQRRRVAEVGKFASVGLIGFLVDVAVFNVLLFSALQDAPWGAKAVSATASGTVCYFLNRHWTWADRKRSGTRRELPMFLVISALGLVITETCLLASHDLLGLTSKLSDNLSANGLGLVLATLFRFWAYRTFVFLADAPFADPEPSVAAHEFA